MIMVKLHMSSRKQYVWDTQGTGPEGSFCFQMMFM